jgi:hypothetical protein
MLCQHTDGARFSILEVVMSTPERSPGFQVVLALLIVTLSPLVLLGSQKRQVTTAWNVQYISASEPIVFKPGKKRFDVHLIAGTEIKVQLGKDDITFQRRKKFLLSIPVAEVTQIVYDHKTHLLSKKSYDAMKGMGSTYGQGEGSGLILIGGVAAMIVTLPFKYTDYFVQILWQENGKMHSIEVKLGRKDCQAFLNALQNMANVQAGQEPPIPKGSKVYIAPMGGFETYLESALSKKKVPLRIVSDKSQADFVIKGNAESQRPPSTFINGDTLSAILRSNEDASIIVTDLKTGKVVYAYAVHKESSYHGKRSAAEACAKHLKQRIAR